MNCFTVCIVTYWYVPKSCHINEPLWFSSGGYCRPVNATDQCMNNYIKHKQEQNIRVHSVTSWWQITALFHSRLIFITPLMFPTGLCFVRESINIEWELIVGVNCSNKRSNQLSTAEGEELRSWCWRKWFVTLRITAEAQTRTAQAKQMCNAVL